MEVFRYVAAQNRDQTTAAQGAGEPHQQKGAVASFQYFAGPPRDILAGRGDHRGDIRSQQGSGGAGRPGSRGAGLRDCRDGLAHRCVRCGGGVLGHAVAIGNRSDHRRRVADA